MNNAKWYESSKGSGLSATIGGLSVAGIVPVIMIIVKMFGWDLSQHDITLTVSLIIEATGVVITLFGLLRKIYFKIKR